MFLHIQPQTFLSESLLLQGVFLPDGSDVFLPSDINDTIPGDDPLLINI